jgi:hypothetical protein
VSFLDYDPLAAGLIPYRENEEWLNGQDPNDPVWESVLPDFHEDVNDPRNMHELGSMEPVRTLSGQLDFGSDVRDMGTQSSAEYIAREFTTHGEGHKLPPGRRNRLPIDVKSLAPSDFRITSFTVGGAVPTTSSVQGGIRVCTARRDRRRVLITNWSSAVIWVAAQSISARDTAGATILNAGQVAASGGTREIFSTAEVWVAANALATAQAFDVQEEFWLDGRDP